MKILIVDDASINREILVMMVENIFPEPETIQKTHSLEAIEEIQSQKNFDLIIADHHMPGGNGNLIYEYLIKKNLEIPFVLCTTDYLRDIEGYEKVKDQNEKKFGFLQKPISMEKVKNLLNEVCPELFGELLQEEYFKVKIPYFFRFNYTKVDIYCRLSDTKFVKIISADNYFTREEIFKYTKKNLTHLYILENEFEKFKKDYGNHTFLSIKKGNPRDTFEAVTSSLEVLHYLANAVGFSNEVTTQTEVIADSIFEDAKNMDTLGPLLLSLKGKKDYIHDHSYFLGYICTLICRNIEWGNAEVIKKLIFASLFHDILVEDPDLAMIMDKKDLENLDYSQEVKNKYIDHPLETCALLEKGPSVPENVAKIVLKHHESPNSEGFLKNFNANQINPLESIFILAHQFLTKLYETDFEREKLPNIIKDLKENFNSGVFKKSFQALEKAVQKIEPFL